jgi:hypothetical protein
MKRYHLTVRNRLLFTRAALKQQRLFRVISLLIDTGARQSIISWETLLSLSIDPSSSSLVSRSRPPTVWFGCRRLRSRSCTLWGKTLHRFESSPIQFRSAVRSMEFWGWTSFGNLK